MAPAGAGGKPAGRRRHHRNLGRTGRARRRPHAALDQQRLHHCAMAFPEAAVRPAARLPRRLRPCQEPADGSGERPLPRRQPGRPGAHGAGAAGRPGLRVGRQRHPAAPGDRGVQEGGRHLPDAHSLPRCGRRPRRRDGGRCGHLFRRAVLVAGAAACRQGQVPGRHRPRTRRAVPRRRHLRRAGLCGLRVLHLVRPGGPLGHARCTGATAQ